MSPIQDLRAVWRALQQQSAVVVGVPPATREVLLRRYIGMSLANGRMAPFFYLVAALVVGYEVALAPRLLLCSAMAANCIVREWRGRRRIRLMDAGHFDADPFYDMLVVSATALWGVGPLLLHFGGVSESNLLVSIYVGMLIIGLTLIGYLSALPLCCVTVAASVAPVFLCLALQGTRQMVALAVGSLAYGVVLVYRVSAAHDILLGVLAAQARNQQLVEELDTYRRALERENASLGSSLRDASHAASRDALTNVYNRRYLTAFAEPLAEAVREHREEVTVCIADVDHFKRINDAFGHPVGDEVLKFIAVLLGARLRDFDCLARYGGEEFAIILRRCDIARGRRVAEALRHNIASAEISTDAGTVEVTISLGIAQWAAGEQLNDVVQRADRALYRAKQSGRDRVEIDSDDALRALGPGSDATFPSHLH